jgi:hypothetical protein
VSLPDNLATLVFRALYPDHHLVCEGDRYATMCRGSLIITDSIGELARYISELHSPDTSLGVLVADSEEPLLRRKFIGSGPGRLPPERPEPGFVP